MQGQWQQRCSPSSPLYQLECSEPAVPAVKAIGFVCHFTLRGWCYCKSLFIIISIYDTLSTFFIICLFKWPICLYLLQFIITVFVYFIIDEMFNLVTLKSLYTCGQPLRSLCCAHGIMCLARREGKSAVMLCLSSTVLSITLPPKQMRRSFSKRWTYSDYFVAKHQIYMYNNEMALILSNCLKATSITFYSSRKLVLQNVQSWTTQKKLQSPCTLLLIS